MAAAHLVMALMCDRIRKGEMDRGEVDDWIDDAVITARFMKHEDVADLLDVQLRKLAHTVAKQADPDDDPEPGASIPDDAENVLKFARR